MIADHDERWNLVGGCPTPGVPDDVGEIARQFAARAARCVELYDGLQSVGRAIAESGWEGRTADAFLTNLARLGPALIDQRDRASATSRAVHSWAVGLHERKQRALQALHSAEDAQRRIAAALESSGTARPQRTEPPAQGDDVTAVKEHRAADEDLAAARALIEALRGRHLEAAAMATQHVTDNTPLVRLTAEVGLIDGTLQAIAPDHLQRPDDDGGHLDAVVSILETIQSSWIGQAEAIGVAMGAAGLATAAAIQAAITISTGLARVTSAAADRPGWAVLTTADATGPVPLQIVQGVVAGPDATEIGGLQAATMAPTAIPAASSAGHDLAPGVLQPPTIPVQFEAALTALPRVTLPSITIPRPLDHLNWFSALQPVVAAAAGDGWLDLVDVDQTFTGPTLESALTTFETAGGLPIAAPLDPAAVPG